MEEADLSVFHLCTLDSIKCADFNSTVLIPQETMVLGKLMPLARIAYKLPVPSRINTRKAAL
jgi:hypothetical protein